MRGSGTSSHADEHAKDHAACLATIAFLCIQSYLHHVLQLTWASVFQQQGLQHFFKAADGLEVEPLEQKEAAAINLAQPNRKEAWGLSLSLSL